MNNDFNEDLLVKTTEEREGVNHGEVSGLSWQAVTAIMFALQNSMMAAALGEEASLEDVLMDFQFSEVEGGDDPGLVVTNPPKVRAFTEDEIAVLATQLEEPDGDS